MTNSGSVSHDVLVSLLWDLKAAWQGREGKEVLLANLLVDRAALDRFLAEAAEVDDAHIRGIVQRIASVRVSLDEESSPPATKSGHSGEDGRSKSVAASPRTSGARAMSGLERLRAGAVLVASLLVSVAAFRYLSVERGDPTPSTATPISVTSKAATTREAPGVVTTANASSGESDASPPVPPPPAPALSLAESDVLLRVHGSNTVGEELTPALAEAYLRARGATEVVTVPGAAPKENSLVARLPTRPRPVAIEIHAHGSSTAFVDLGSGSTDLGQSSRRIKPEEVERLAAKQGDLSKPGSEHVVALDGLAIIVHPGNSVTNLGIEQIAGIFAGQVKDWSQLGGTAGPITLYARDDVSGTWDTFKSLVLAPNGLELEQSARRFESSSELSDAVASDPHAIGFIGLPYVRRSKALAVSAKASGFALLPTSFTVGTEDYPLSRRLYFYAPAGSANDNMNEFIDFALSDAGQEIVKQVGFVSQNISLTRPHIDQTFPSEYRAASKDADRLSVNFRFEAGSEELDAKGWRDLDRIVTFLARAPVREIELFGFTDDRGSARANLALSKARADVVAKALEARGVFCRKVYGFGPAIPVASNANEEGRNRNRRVEVWIR